MPAEFFLNLREVASSNNWLLIWPELCLGLLALLLLVVEAFRPNRSSHLVAMLSIIVHAVLFVGLLVQTIAGPAEPVEAFGGLITVSALGNFARLFFLLASAIVCHLGLVYLKKQELPRVEFFHIVTVVTAALMLLVQSTHMVMLFVALETVTVGFYILVSYGRNDSLSLEAGLKYLILGALSSAILLFGIVLLYGMGGNPTLPGHVSQPMNFEQLRFFLEANPDNLICVAGAILVIAGLAFKIGAVPFQIWIPDVYQGAPTPTVAFLAVSSKAAGIFVLLNLVAVPFAPLFEYLMPLLVAVTIATVLYGNITPLGQQNVKRIVGLSGVSHAGYLMIGVCAYYAGVEWAGMAVYFYLVLYLLASFAVLEVMGHMASSDDPTQQLDQYRDLLKRQPLMATVLAIGLGSLAGIPPLGGFVAKFIVLVAAFQAELYWLLAIAVIGVVLSIYYYFGWIRSATFRAHAGERMPPVEEPVPAPVVGFGAKTLMVCLAVLTVVLGFYQGFLSDIL